MLTRSEMPTNRMWWHPWTSHALFVGGQNIWPKFNICILVICALMWSTSWYLVTVHSEVSSTCLTVSTDVETYLFTYLVDCYLGIWVDTFLWGHELNIGSVRGYGTQLRIFLHEISNIIQRKQSTKMWLQIKSRIK